MEAYQQLEREFAQWAGVADVVACSSGSAALHLALESLQLPPGSAVITGDFNMISCPRSITLAGLTPIFVDCGPDLLIDPDFIDQAAAEGDNVRAVLVTHIYGRRASMDVIVDLATKYDLHLVEDLCEAHGVPPHPATDAACWSFFRNKIVAGEEGGAVAFRDPQAAALARQLRCLGFTDAHDFMHQPRGCNYRLANSLACLVLDSLRQADDNLRARRRIEGWYEAACPPEWRMPPRDACWVYDIRLPGLTKERQTAIVRALNAAGIPARHAFQPMSWQPEYCKHRTYGGANARVAANEVIYLPVVPGQTTEESVRLAFDILRRALA